MKYVPTLFNRKVYLPLTLIREATDDNWLDSLCYFVWLKNLHQKPVIYNFSLRRTGAAIGCSPTTLGHHVAILTAKGLCERDGAYLFLKSTNRLKEEYKCLVPVGISDNKAEQRNFLRFTLIKRNLHTQYKAYSKKNDILNFAKGLRFDWKQAKRLYKAAQNSDLTAVESSLQDEMTLSNRKFGFLCNRSISTGLKVQKWLNDLQLITSSSRTKLLGKGFSPRMLNTLDINSSYFLSKKGNLFKRLSNKISLSEIVVC